MNRSYITEKDYEVAKNNGISRKLLRYRVYELGWNTDKASNMPKLKKGNNSKIYCRYVRKLAEKNGISHATLYNRIIKIGMSPYEAATRPVLNVIESRKLGNKANTKYNQYYLKLAERNNISNATFRKRMRDGWSYEDASTKPVITPKEKGGNDYWRKDNKLIFVKKSS